MGRRPTTCEASIQNPKPEIPIRRGALGVIFLIILTDLLGFGIIIPLLPFYAKAYDASPLKVTLLFSIYSICQFIASPILGAISDRHGRRPVLIFSQFGSVAGYILLGVVTHHQWTNATLALGLVYLSRIIDGLSGGNISTAQAYISDVTSSENRAKGMGLIGAAFGIGFALGPAIGGILGGKDEHAALPAYAAALMSFVAMVLTWWRLPESSHSRPVASEVWLHPAQFLPVLRRPLLAQLMAVSFASMVAFVMLDSTATLYMIDRFHYSRLEAGLLFAYVGAIIALVQGGLIGRLTRSAGEWKLSIVGPALVAVGMLVLAQAYWAVAAALALILVGNAFNAVGRSFQQPTLSSLVSKYSLPPEQGVVFGLFHGLGSMARVVGPIIAGIAYSMHATGPMFVGATIIAAVAVWTGVLRWMAPPPLQKMPDQEAVAAAEG